ncbi:PIN domain-containing protein [Sulfurisphaera ohwakuensis]
MKLLQELKLSYKLWNDAIIFSQMKRLGIDVIYSNDRDFDPFHVSRKF